MGEPAAGGAGPPRRCASCGASLRLSARFCDQCGTALTSVPERGADDIVVEVETAGLLGGHPPVAALRVEIAKRDPRAYTPAHLAERILRSRSALEGERKQVTVLFLDIRGSMELADQVDAEEWHQILDRFFQLVTEGVHACEGTVNQYTGDGIMALFGAPIAHEDHAVRACHAALRIQDTLRGYADELRRRGLSFSIRMGLHSGEVVVGRIGDDLRMDYTAQGLTVGLAERVQRLAAPDQAYLTEATARLIEGFFQLDDLGQFHLRGVRGAVRVFALAGLGSMRSRFDRARTRGLSRFVGRGDEMGLLEAALERAVSGLGQVVGVVAPAGTGKSRLCHELVQSGRARGIAVQEAHGVAHGRMVPLLPVVELLRGMFDVRDTDGPRVTRNKVAGELLQLDRAFAPSLPLLFDLLGVTDAHQPSPRVEPEIRERQLLSVVQRLLVRASELRPQILLFEDLQWLDPTSEAFLEAAVEAAAGTRTLVLVNYRPDYRPPWGGQQTYQELSLAPLDGGATAELVASWIGTDASLAGLTERIQEHAAGNPLFIEEMIRELIETNRLVGSRGAFHLTEPVLSLAVPSSVQTILAARIDRLDEAAKSLLATAAVIGKRVPEALLREVSGLAEPEYQRTLVTLLDSDFLCAAEAGPEHECDFRHPLTQEVAYTSQLAERRRRTHAEVGRALERRHAERVDEKAALLAYHWTQAGEALTAARWHGRAARWSGGSNQVAALEHWQAVRRCLATSEAPAEGFGSRSEPRDAAPVNRPAEEGGAGTPDTFLDDLGIEASIGALLVGLYAADDDFDHDEVFRDGCARAERLRDSRRLALLHAAYAGALFVYRSESFEEHAERALREAEATGDAALLLAVRARLYLFLLRMRGPNTVKPLIEAALETAPLDPLFGREHFAQSPRLRLLRDLGYAELMSGRPRDARAVFAGAMDIARGHGNLADQLSIECGSVMIALFQHEVEEALATTRAVLRHAEFVGSRYWLRGAYSMLAAVHLERGDLAHAAAAVDRAETFRHRWQPVTSAGTGVALEIWHRTEQSERALREERANHPGEGLGALPHRTRRIVGARIAIEREGAAARAVAVRLLDEEEHRARTTGARFRLPFVHLERAALARCLGDPAGCLRQLEESHRLFVDMEAPRRAAQVEQTLRSLG